MNKIGLYIIFLALLALVSCRDDNDTPYPVTDVAWYTSLPREISYNVNEGGFIAFIDASQNELSHKWILEGDGTSFLKPGFTKTDDLSLWVDKKQGKESKSYTASVLFQKAGKQKVRLYNTFDKKVTFRGKTPLEAVKKGNIWVIDTTFVVDVYANMKPAFNVFQINEDKYGKVTDTTKIITVTEDQLVSQDNAAKWPVVNVKLGNRLYFVDMTTTDRPTGRQWSINTGVTDPVNLTDSAATVTFLNQGFKGALGKFTSERVPAAGGTLIPESRALKIIPLKVNVIKTDKVLALKKVYENSDKTITVETGALLNTFSGKESYFTVNYVNGSKRGTIKVSKAEVDSNNAAFIKLTVSGATYFDDKLTISYNGNGIKSQDGRALEPFSGEKIVNSPGISMLATNAKFADFEGVGAPNTGGAYGYWVGKNTAWSRVESDNGIAAQSGKGFMKFDADPSTNPLALSGMKVAEKVSIKAGKYIVRHHIYIPSTCKLKVLRTDFAIKENGWGSSPEVIWDLTKLPRDKWVTIEKVVNVTVDLNSGQMNRYSYYVRSTENPGITGKQVLYLDNLELFKLNQRP